MFTKVSNVYLTRGLPLPEDGGGRRREPRAWTSVEVTERI